MEKWQVTLDESEVDFIVEALAFEIGKAVKRREDILDKTDGFPEEASLDYEVKPLIELASKLNPENLNAKGNREDVLALEHHRDSTVGLWATDKEPADKTDFHQITFKAR